MSLPYNNELKVVDLELSNKNFISVIRSNISISHAKSVQLERCIYPSDHLLAELSSRVYKEQESCFQLLQQDWFLLTTAKNSGDGYFGAAYWNPNNQQVVIAHQGTSNPRDIWADYQGILSNRYTSQMSSATTFSNYVAGQMGKFNEGESANLSLSITGHSLGGWLAQITAFTTRYLTRYYTGENAVFVKCEKEGFNAHTVVFDSPGCKDMLLKMEDDFDIRYDGKPHSSLFLDVTIYLSAPNLVNTLHSHLNVGNLFRVFIEDLPTRTSSWDLLQYTAETHKMDKIKKVLASKENSISNGKILKVKDWPQVKEGLSGIILEKLVTLFTDNQNEYERFHKFANRTNDYNPPPDDDKFCTFRYQVQKVEKEECSANIFTHSEFNFLNEYRLLKQFSMFAIAEDLFLSLQKSTKGEITREKLQEILKTFELKDGVGHGFIKCSSEEELKRLITCVKIILSIFPNIHTLIKDRLKNLDVYTDIYEKQSFDFLQSIKSVEFKMAPKEIVADSLNKHQILQLMCKQHTVIGIKKLSKILEETKGISQFSKSFFLSLKQLVNLEQFFPLHEFVKQSLKDISVLFVVENSIENFKEERQILIKYFKRLFSTLQDKRNIKFILVSKKKIDLECCLGNNNNFYCEIEDGSEIRFQELTEDSQKQLLKKKVYFQGERISFSSLLTNESKDLLDEETLTKLINNETIRVGKELLLLNDNDSCYIDRTFLRYVKIKKEIKKDFNFFIISDDQIKNIAHKNGQDVALISKTGENFDKLCNDYKNYNIHWLKEEDDHFEWQKSRGDLSRLREYVDTEIATECEIDGPRVIISSVSGAGKSTVLTKLSQKMKAFDPSLWIIRLNLNDYTKKLQNEEFHNDKSEIFNFLMDISGLNSPLERELFKHRLNTSGKVALLFDGFDEIVPRYKEKVAELFKALKNTKLEKLWITTRPNMKNDLEDILGVSSYFLKPLSREDQMMFIKYYFCKILKLSIGDNFENYANSLLDCVLQPISDKNKEFSEVPLHMKMLIETFQEEIKTSYNLSSKDEINLFKKINLMDLYNKFVESKYKRHFSERKILDQTKAGPEFEMLYDSFIEKYSLLSLSALFDEEDLNNFLTKKELDKIKCYLGQVQEGKENSGFISHMVGVKPIFIHFSFAEYFAAMFFTNNIERKTIKNYFRNTVYGKEHYLTSIFFDYIVTRDKDNCEIHISVLNNDEDKVIQLLSNAVEVTGITNATDKVGRTALHLAAAYGYSIIAKILLDLGFSVQTEDQFLGWRPLRYADKNAHWEIVELFLENGASADDLCEAKKSLQDYSAANPGKTLLHEAANKGLLKVINALLEIEKTFINIVDQDERIALHYAKNRDVADLLIQKGADIHAEDCSDFTPLFYAESIGIVELLIEKGANINATGWFGFTPLHKAVINNRKDVVEVLIKNGADIEAENVRYETPLFYVSSKEIFEILLEQDADIHSTTRSGDTPLHEAVKYNRREIVELLMRNGANIEARNVQGKTPLFYADNNDILQLLWTEMNKEKSINMQKQICEIW